MSNKDFLAEGYIFIEPINEKDPKTELILKILLNDDTEDFHQYHKEVHDEFEKWLKNEPAYIPELKINYPLSKLLDCTFDCEILKKYPGFVSRDQKQTFERIKKELLLMVAKIDNLSYL